MKTSKTDCPDYKSSKSITIAENAGFCCGVQRAVDIAAAAAEKHGKVYTIGRLVHNNDVIAMLEKKNVFSVDDVDGLPHDSVAIIRSHGIGSEAYTRLADTNTVYYDATCPYVKKIHELVKGKSGVIIAGNQNHPEVKGIVGHVTGKCFIINSHTELLKQLPNIRQFAQIFVAQTTFNEYKWRECTEIIKKHCTNVKIFDTICNATVERQNTARELSKKCDVMIVIGSSHSSNSKKLYEICAEHCKSKNTYFIENAEALSALGVKISKSTAVGVVAGASVPSEIIKEVHSIMNTELKNVDTENNEGKEGKFDFMAEVDKTFQKLHTGKRVKAYVMKVNSNEVIVDLGVKQSGYIPADEIGGDPGSTPDMLVKPGETIECIVTRVNDVEGIVYLSKKRVDSELGFEKLEAAYKEDAVLDGYVASVVNSGVIVTYEGQRIFVPASQSGVPRNGKLEEILKKTVKFKVIEINEQRKRLVGSIRAASRMENDAVKEKFWSEIEVGKSFTGEVKSIESYGVFVDLGGVDGMVHLSELTWKRVKHPKEIVEIGQSLQVTVKGFDPEKRRVSLTAKNPDENPWTKFLDEYSVGSPAKATIVNITPFGAFAQIMEGIDGLIHISQISRDRIKSVNEILSVGEVVDVQITEIDAEKERVSISMRALLEPDEQPEEAVEAPEVDEAPEIEAPVEAEEEAAPVVELTDSLEEAKEATE
jgi:4-hydroxy-3-methylbut-2-enyl diphosphate reductase